MQFQQSWRNLLRSSKSKAGLYRLAEGRAIQTLLPSCPKIWEKDIGTGILVANDYEHPKCKLTKKELFYSLGQPDSSYNDTVSYVLVHDTNNTFWQISVELRLDYVVGSTITGSFKSNK
jgi:hypothetical protein